MVESETHTNRERRREERKVWRTGLLLSVLVHVLVFALFPVQTILLSPFSAAGPRSGDPEAASGSMQAMNLRPPAPVPIVPPPIPIPVDVEIEPVEFDDPPVVDPSPVLSEGTGMGEGKEGTEEGQGRGDGGTGDEGLNRMTPPAPRGMIIPPHNKKLKGSEVEIWVFVNEQGRVVADSTRLRPPTSDRDFNRQLIREAADWVFRPATRGGQPVATWWPYTLQIG